MMFDYELFIIHAEADRAFVHGHLLPALGLAAERVLLSSGLPLGAPIASAIERGVRTSRLTVAVLTPAYMADRWAMFGEQLAGYANGVEGGLIPLLLADCEVPLRLDFLVALDFRDPSRWAAEAQRLRERLARPAPVVAELPCPYPGMRPYTAKREAQLHGREAEVDEIVDRIRAGEREIHVIGPSGSGKSSLVAAGVLPRLTRGVSGLGKLLVRSLSHSDRPTQQLAQVLEGELEGELAAPVAAVDALLARHAPAASLVLAIDPLEELFLRASDDERAGFLVALRALRDDPRCVLVYLLRANWSGAFLDGALRADRQGRGSRVEVAPLQGAALCAASERPARDLGVCFEPELVERLLADVASEPGILPFLQEALGSLLDDVELIDAKAWHRTEAARELGESLVAALVVASRAALEDAARKRHEVHEVHEELVASRSRLWHLLAQSYWQAGRRLMLDGDPLQALPYQDRGRSTRRRASRSRRSTCRRSIT
jgi:TIR domain